MNVTGYVVDIIKTSTHISSDGYTYISGAVVTVGNLSNTTSSNGYFNVSGVDTTIATVTVVFPRYEITTVGTTSGGVLAVWKNHGYT
jgi:hypothetical protein